YLAQQSAITAVRLLRGEAPAGVPALSVGPGAPRYDARELDRWNISEERLPVGAEILFREPGLWDRYRIQIAAVSSALVLQALLISWLLYEHRRRHLAEVRSRAMMTELTHVNRLATAGELSASLAHEINQPLTSVVAKASAAARWLTARPPDIAKVQS